MSADPNAAMVIFIDSSIFILFVVEVLIVCIILNRVLGILHDVLAELRTICKRQIASNAAMPKFHISMAVDNTTLHAKADKTLAGIRRVERAIKQGGKS